MSAITRDPETRGGEPCIEGTRIPVALLLAELIDDTVEAFAADRDLNLAVCRAAAEQAVEEYARPNEVIKRLQIGCNPECPGCGVIPCNEQGDAVLWCDECYGKADEQVKLLRDIGRIVKAAQLSCGSRVLDGSKGVVMLKVGTPQQAIELHSLLLIATKVGGDDES